jgi:outer membrane receptor protein involved in Fe transport
MNKSLCLTVLLLAVLNMAYTQAAPQGKVSDTALNQAVPGGLQSPSFASLDEVIISGNREVQRRTEVPVAINVISKALINDTKATRLDMLINTVPGVFMVDLGNEQHSMAVRQPIGTKNLFLYMEDGIPIRTVGDFNHNALIEINQASLERIEVIKGPASSLYGSEAVGGAINFITQTPSPLLTGKIQAEVGSRGYKRTDFNISNTYKKFGFFAGGYYADQSQPADEHNDFNKVALTLRADYNFSDRTKLVTVADYIKYKTDQKCGLDSAHFYGKDYLSFYRFTYRKVDAFRLRSTLSTEWNENNKTSFTVFYRNSTIGQNPFYRIANISGNPSKAKGQVDEDGFYSYGTVVQHTKELAALKTKWISGVSIDYNPSTYFARYIDIDKDASGVYKNYIEKDSMLTDYGVDLVNTAVYTQLEYKPIEQLKIVAAGRYDRMNYRFDNHLSPSAFTGAPDARDHFGQITPKLGVTYDFGMGKGAYLNYSVGFAPPNITDLYTGVKVPVLKPATYKNYEAGGWIAFVSKKGLVEISAYQLDGKNEIISVRVADGSYQNQNAGETSHKGIELNIRYAPIEELTFRVGGTYAEHKFIEYVQQGKDYSGYKMPQAPPVIINGEVTFKPHYLKGFRIAVEYQGMSSYFTDPLNTAKYKGFSVFNARAGYSLKGFELWVNCINITDRIYATSVEKSAFGTSYRPGQLSTINAGLAYHFSRNKQQVPDSRK